MHFGSCNLPSYQRFKALGRMQRIGDIQKITTQTTGNRIKFPFENMNQRGHCLLFCQKINYNFPHTGMEIVTPIRTLLSACCCFS